MRLVERKVSKKIIHLTDFWPTPAFSNELLKIYLATGLKIGKPEPDEDEFLKKGQIKDAKTIIAIQTYLIKNKLSS
jgi:ADP-ribose pyrophosphatase